MISKTLLKQTIRENYTLWLILTLVQGVLIFVLAWTVSSVAMTGMTYYNMLPGMLAAVYTIVTGNKLLSSLVDEGTMAYILSTPVKRSTVAITQAVYFVGSIFIMYFVNAAAHITSAAIFSDVSGWDIGMIVKLNLGLFVLLLAYSGITFIFSSIFNLSKNTIAVGGGIVGLFVLLPIVSMFGKSLQWLKI